MKIIKYLLIFACFVPLLLLRDFTPNNELKYLSIADEALRNGHIFTFYNHGMIYADKPPLYFWFIMLAKWISGSHYMFFLGLFSLLPALAILHIMDKWVRNDLHPSVRTTGQLMLITSGLFAGSAIVLRMDMLMCMFIVLALYTFYKLYTGHGTRWDPVKLPVYIFLALFAKGPIGLLVPLLSMVCFLLIKGEIRTLGKYMGWKQWAILIGLSFFWFYGVYSEGGKTYLNNLVFNQTINRAIDSFHHKEPVWYYFKTIWHSLAPWILFYVVVIGIGIKKRLIDNDLKKLFLTIITSTFVVLSLFSSKLDIYMLPIFPFIAYLSFLIFPDLKENGLRFTIAIPALILFAAFPVFFMINHFSDHPVPPITMIPVTAFILSVFSGICLYFLWKKRFLRSANILCVGILLAILIGGVTTSKLNPYIGFKEICRKAETIALEKDIRLFYFYKFRSGENLDVYLNREIQPIQIDDISLKSIKQNFIIFVRNKDIRKEIQLQEIIKNKQIYTIVDYSFIIFKFN